MKYILAYPLIIAWDIPDSSSFPVPFISTAGEAGSAVAALISVSIWRLSDGCGLWAHSVKDRWSMGEKVSKKQMHGSTSANFYFSRELILHSSLMISFDSHSTKLVSTIGQMSGSLSANYLEWIWNYYRF